jgi:DNA adenine methylase
LFSREDFGRLAGLLGAVKGKFILSLNDTPGVRETFANFRIEAVKTRYSVSGTKKQEAAEVLITNFKLSTGGR